MNRYICTSCGHWGYSAASPDAQNDNRCPRTGCFGSVVPDPETAKRITDIDAQVINRVLALLASDEHVKTYDGSALERADDYIAKLECDVERLTARAEKAEAELVKLREAQMWIPISEKTPNIGDVVEVCKVSKEDRARYRPDENEFFPWRLIGWPSPETEEGTFMRRTGAVTHWRGVQKEATP